MLLTAVRNFFFFSSVIKELFSKVDEHIEKGDLIREFNMSALPSLYDQFVRLIEYLVCMKNLGLI